jgi:hypothetical protein
MRAPDRALADRCRALLTGCGVDVDRALARVEREREGDRRRAREAAAGIRSLAVQLKGAEKALGFEAQGVLDGAAGFNRATLGEAQERVSRLEAALLEACSNDRSLARQVRRAVV